MTAELHEIIKNEAKEIVKSINRQENDFIKNAVFSNLFGRIATRAELRKIEKFPSAQNPNNTHVRYQGNWLGTLTPQVINEEITFVFYPTENANQVLLRGRASGKKFSVTNVKEMKEKMGDEKFNEVLEIIDLKSNYEN